MHPNSILNILGAAAITVAAFILLEPAQAQTTSQFAEKAARALVLDVAMLDDSRMIAVGERGHVLVGAETVEQKIVPTDRLLTSVAVQGDVVLVGGHDASIMRSADQGETWEVVYEDADWGAPVLSILWQDADVAVAAGGFGLLLISEDSGVSWELVDVDLDAPHFYDIAAFGEAGLTIIGEFGTVWRSETLDGAWRRLDVPYEGSLFGAQRLNDGRLMVFGLQGNAFLEDENEGFVERDTGTSAGLLDGALLADGRLLLVGRAGATTVYDPTLDSFSLVPRQDREDFATVTLGLAGRLLVGGEMGLGVIAGEAYDFSPIDLATPGEGA